MQKEAGKLKIRVLALIRHPFSSRGRKAYRRGHAADASRPESGTYVKLVAFWRHPLNSRKRKSYRRSCFLQSTPEFVPLLGKEALVESTAAPVSPTKVAAVSDKKDDGSTLDEVPPQTAESGAMRAEISIARRLAGIDSYRQQISSYSAGLPDRCARKQGRIVIYSAISADYDSIKLPSCLDSKFDYVMFTDQPAPETGIWQIRHLPYLGADPTRSCRYVKTHPHHLFNGYEYAVWIDANIMITGDLMPMIETFVASGRDVAGIPHPFRTSIYEEVEACVNRDDAETMLRQVQQYRESGFEHDDLIETNLMIFRLSSPRIHRFLDAWWREIDRGSKRDQLSVNYALREAKLDWLALTRWPDSARNHPLLARWPHDGGAGSSSRLAEAVSTGTVDPFGGRPFSEMKDEIVAQQRERTIDIVVCVHNALDDVRGCLESVVRFRRGENQRLIIVDDGSAQPTRDYLDEFARGKSWVTVLRHDAAAGYTKSANAGLRASTAEFVILLNSDTVVTDGWAEKMCHAVFSTPGAGVVGPLSNAASYQSIPDHRATRFQTAVNNLPPGMTPDDLNAFCEANTVYGVLPLVPIVHGFCLALTRETIEKVGYFDEENFSRGYGEENDYCLRATDAGVGLVIAMHTFIYHAKSKSYVTKERLMLVDNASKTLRRLHGKERVARAVRTLEANTILAERRARAADLAALVPWLSQDLLRKRRTARSASLASVVMCAHGQVEATARSLQSLAEQEAGVDFELILVDNGSKPKEAHQLRELAAQYPFAKFVVNPGNFNLSAGRNLGCLAAVGTNIVFLSNSVEVSPTWLSELLKPLQDRSVKGAQPCLLGPDGTIDSAGIVFSDQSPMGYRLYSGRAGDFLPALRPRALAALSATCLAVRTDEFEAVGGFDVNFLNDLEDVDLCLRMGDCKPVFQYAPGAIVVHHAIPAPEKARNAEANRRLFYERWRGKVRADDMLHYAEDNVVVQDYAPDHDRWTGVGYAVWRPKQPSVEQHTVLPVE